MKVILTLVILSGTWLSSFSQSRYREEFNGPFKSWANVKTRFNASGDGKKDDTKALQAAPDSLTTSQRTVFNTDARSKYLVVYLPAGTYKISQTLRLTGKIGVCFIGEDPEKTIIRWDGQDNDTMMFSNRSAYVKMSRITWNANNKKNIEAVGFHYKDFNKPNFAPTTIELSDMVFKGNTLYGISAGTYAPDGTGMMDAEFTIKRCKFYSCTGAGLKMLIWNINNYHKRNPLLFLKQKMSSKIAMMGITSQCFKSKDKSCLTEDPQSLSDVVVNVSNVKTFISEMTSDNRKAMPKPFFNLENGVSNIYISRVSTYNGGTAYTFRK